jgi:putative ABC transport system permease protein
MNLPYLSWKYLAAKPLNTVLNILILSLGIAIIIVLLLLDRQLEEKLNQNAKGIDLVIGAKGSPLQLVLCNIFHIDFPTGNISLAEARKLAGNPMVKKAIPLALGDSYESFRIVGTNHAFADHYQLQIAKGAMWQTDMEATIGANVAYKIGANVGDTFMGAHGMDDAAGDAHEGHAYKIVGIFQPTGSVADNLILTNIRSVWMVHEHDEEEENHEEEHTDHEDHAAETSVDSAATARPNSAILAEFPIGDSTKEITAMLVKFKSPMAAITMPRIINAQTQMQAASPAFETARLFTILGVGIDLLKAFAYLMVFIAVLSIFIALYNTLKEKKYDLAVIRSLGASQGTLFFIVIFEGILITAFSALVGLAMGHGAVEAATHFLEASERTGFSGWIFLKEEVYVFGIALILGMLTALIPAIQAYRTDISQVLAEG